MLGGASLPLGGEYPAGDYFALVARALRASCDVYAWRLTDRLPTIPIPLKQPDPDVMLDLAGVFATVYERGRFLQSLDYTQPPALDLPPEDLQWIWQQASPPTK